MEDFAELCYTLKLYVGEDFVLPSSDVLMQIFGRVSKYVYFKIYRRGLCRIQSFSLELKIHST